MSLTTLCVLLASLASPLVSMDLVGADGRPIPGSVVAVYSDAVLVSDTPGALPRLLLWSAVDDKSVRTSEAIPVHFRNGDRLTGRVLRVEDGRLILESAFSGEISIPLEALEPASSLLASSPATADLATSGVIDARIENGIDEVVQDPATPQTFLEPHDWRGKLALLGTLRTGNTDSYLVSLQTEAMKQWTEDRLGAKFDASYGETEDDLTASSLFGSAKFDHFYSEDWYSYANASALFDEVADINIRAILGIGGGANLWRGDEDPSKQLFEVELGVSMIYEEFSSGSGGDVEPAVRAAYSYRNLFFDEGEFSQTFEFVAPFQELDAFIVRVVTTFAVPLSESWNLNNSLVIDWQGEPAPGAKALDLSLLVGLEYSF